MADPDETFRRLIEAAQRSATTWEGVLLQARERLATDPLLAQLATAAVRVVESSTARSAGVAYEELDAVRHGARLGAALALVIAERPELITGEPPTGAPPVEVIAARLAPLLGPDYSSSVGLIRQAAGAVLTALALQGWEVTRRADRFASLDHDGHTAVRIPLRGTCGICRGPVSREVDGTFAELLIGPWRHPGEAAGDGRGHEPALVDAP